MWHPRRAVQVAHSGVNICRVLCVTGVSWSICRVLCMTGVSWSNQYARHSAKTSMLKQLNEKVLITHHCDSILKQINIVVLEK